MKFPVFSLLAGNLAFSETSSQLTPPSSGESIANPTFGGASHDDRLLAPYLLRRRVLSTSMLERLTAGPSRKPRPCRAPR